MILLSLERNCKTYCAEEDVNLLVIASQVASFNLAKEFKLNH